MPLGVDITFGPDLPRPNRPPSVLEPRKGEADVDADYGVQPLSYAVRRGERAYGV